MLASLIVPIDSRGSIQVVLDTLTVLNCVYLRAHPDTPTIYGSGVRYQREESGLEEWLTVPIVLRRGYGDCEDLACWLAAQERVRGVSARAVVYKSAPNKWHIVVKYPDGRIEDPSRKLGM